MTFDDELILYILEIFLIRKVKIKGNFLREGMLGMSNSKGDGEAFEFYTFKITISTVFVSSQSFRKFQPNGFFRYSTHIQFQCGPMLTFFGHV